MKPRICYVRHRYYGDHPRVDKQIAAMKDAGYDIDLLVMSRKGEVTPTIEDGIMVHRVPGIPRVRGSKLRYLAEYFTFVLTAMVALGWLQFRRGYDVVHLHSLPDFLAFSALIPKLMGAKVIIDLHEPVPEQYHTKFGVKINGLIYRIMAFAEQSSIAFADKAVTCTALLKKVQVSRGTHPDKIVVILDSADAEELAGDVQALKRDDDNVYFITHGLITARYGHDVMIRALKKARENMPNLHLQIFGKGEFVPELQKLTTELGLQDVVHFEGFVDKDVLMANLLAADAAIIALHRDLETNLVLTHKMHEYIALGLPIIATRTDALEHYLPDNAIMYFSSGNVEELASKMIELARNPEKAKVLRQNMQAAFEQHGSSVQRTNYRQTIDALLRTRRGKQNLQISQDAHRSR